MTTYQKEQQKNVVEGFSEFLNMASLYGMNILKKEIHNENDTVKLMTLHASKGLEFSHVFITGVNYGLIPLQTKSFEEEEEEQRLFFVGITRAKEHLELSYYTSPGQYRAAPGPSRYLRMIPGNLIEGQEKDRGVFGNAFTGSETPDPCRACRAYRTARSRQNIRGKKSIGEYRNKEYFSRK